MPPSITDVLSQQYDAIVIGSGFGASVAITKLAEADKSVLVLERGTWWGNPEGPAAPPNNKPGTPKFEGPGVDQRQWWARPNSAKGINYVLDSIYKEVDPVLDFINPFVRDRDLGLRKNLRGLFRLTRFSHEHGNVDVVSGSAVGGGSLFYSGVNLVPKRHVLERVGLGHLNAEAFDRAGRWMQAYRGRMNKVATLTPVPHLPGSGHHLVQPDPNRFAPEYEMPDPVLPEHEADYLMLPRARILRDAHKRASADLQANGGVAEPWHPLPLSVVEHDVDPWDADDFDITAGDTAPPTSATTLAAPLGNLDQELSLASLADLPLAAKTEFSLLIAPHGTNAQAEIVTVVGQAGAPAANRLRVVRGTWRSRAGSHEVGAQVRLLRRGQSSQGNAICLREGRCMLGCLPSARHTLYKTIQVLAQRGKRVAVLPETKVSHVGRANGRYQVHFESHLSGDRRTYSKESNVLILGAGVLGTNEILLRSHRNGLRMSPRLGHGFSTNGDFFGFATRVDRFDKDGKEKTKRNRVNPTVGPINASGFNVAFGNGVGRVDVNVEDAGIPETFAQFIRTILPGFKNLGTLLQLAKAAIKGPLLGMDPFDGLERPDTGAQEQRGYMTERELLSDLFFFNCMGAGPDEPLGTLSLDDDESGLKLGYSAARPLHSWPVFERAVQTMSILAKHMNTRPEDFLVSPFWAAEKRVTVVHPLGGCSIGPHREAGVVDDLGRVYDGASQSNTAVLPGLYVVDASVVPGAIGVNPTYTIVTQAVRTVDHMLKSWP